MASLDRSNQEASRVSRDGPHQETLEVAGAEAAFWPEQDILR